jgi:hypothetical protein
MGKKIMTPRKEAILRMLEADYDEGGRDCLASEFGRPPLTATTVAEYIDWFGYDNGRTPYVKRPDGTIEYESTLWRPSASQVQSFARTLRQMADEGLLVQVREKQQTRNALARDVVDMTRTAYYSAKTVEDNKLHRVRSAYTENAAKGSIIDGDYIREVSPTVDTYVIADDIHVTDATFGVSCAAAPAVGPDGEWQLF